MKKIGIVGGSGYTGAELLRLLLPRDDVSVEFVSSRANQGTRLDTVFSSLRGFTDLEYSAPDSAAMAACDLVFYATPNGTAMNAAAELLEQGVRIIDLSADFRFRDVQTWETWYGMKHAAPALLEEAAYGLPELCREEIRSARIVGNPGCYPTAVQIGYMPLLEHGLIDPAFLVADAKSGVSGAGRGATVDKLYAEAGDNFKAYATPGHRHQPEIEQGLNRMSQSRVDLTFTPHLLPVVRGIEASLYGRLLGDTSLDAIQQLYEQRYADEPFVDVMPPGSQPEIRSVRGTNMCRLAVHKPLDRDKVVVLAVEDNLVKGAAGQAVQCMNLMLGFAETAGLVTPAVLP